MDLAHACDLPASVPVAPCTIIIFGASGDLTSRKLIPALFSLYAQGKLPDPVAIVGCARSTLTDGQFREQLFAQLPSLLIFGAMDLEQAPATPIPLHEGAARYYRERELSR